MTLTPTQMSCVEFGRELIRTADLDPLYTILDAAQLDHDLLGRFLLAYGMYYSAGVSAHIAEADDFWGTAAALIPTAPRGTERRHFRGGLAHKSIAFGASLGAPEEALKLIYPGEGPLTFAQVYKGAQRLHGFGSWISFKMADIADRTRYRTVDFAGCELSIYRTPVQGSALWRYGDEHAKIASHEVGEVCEEVRLAVGPDLLAPPLYDRPINIQEVETVLCKFHSHKHGHYPLGKDTREILHGLHGWGPLADRLAACPLL